MSQASDVPLIYPENPKVFSVKTAPDYQAAKATWLIMVLVLTLGQLPLNNWSFAKILADAWILQFATIIAALRILLPVLWEPLFFRVDSETQTLTYSWVRVPWKKVFNIRDIRCHITEQVSHSGVRHYFLLFVDNKQLLNIEASTRWPLQTLRTLHNVINSQN